MRRIAPCFEFSTRGCADTPRTRRVLQEAGGKDRVHTASADVGDMAALKAAMAWLTAEAGPVDVAIANAGIAIPKKLVDQTVAEAESTMRVRSAAGLTLDATIAPKCILCAVLRRPPA